MISDITNKLEQQFLGLIEYLEKSGTLPSDSSEERLKKAILTFIAVIIGVAAVLWSTIYFAHGFYLSAAIPGTYAVISFFSVKYFFRTKRYGFFRLSQLLLVLLLPFILMWSLGGFSSGSAVILWALFTPIGGLMFGGIQQSTWWYLAYILLILISCVFDTVFMQYGPVVPKLTIIIFYFLNIGGVSSTVYFLLRYSQAERLKTLATLAEDKKEITDLHDNLELKVDEQTQIIRNQLTELKKIDKLKDEFLANTSHEIRTPINGIIGIADSMIDKLQTHFEPEEIITNLSMVVTCGQRLSNLVNDILDFSKLKHQNIELQIKPVDIHQSIDVVLMLSKSTVKNKKIRLINRIDHAIPPVDADENRVQQILYNLIGNAIKFTENGDVVVSAEVIAERVFISIQDTGIGIPENRLAHIFQSFEQADGSTAREYGGTGLGLTISKQLVALHGGEIDVKSTVGVGSTFTFSLSVSQEKIDDRNEVMHLHDIREDDVIFKKTAPMKADNSTSENTDFNVLIVDDEPVNLQVLKNHLSLQNYHVTQALNGIDALKLLEEKQHFDLILLDIMMPKMSGYEACKTIREQYYSANELPVLMLTAKNTVKDLVAGFESGANDYLTKPFSKSELLARIQTQLQLLKRGRELKDYSERLEKMVEERTCQLSETNVELDEKNRQIHSSLLYAVKMQHSLLPDDVILQQSFNDYFVIWEPRDVVSGDIYFCYPTPSGCLLAVIDCTGHGVPGAFMTMIAGAGFESILYEKQMPDPASLLNRLNKFVIRTLRQQLKDSSSNTGMDMGICFIDKIEKKIIYAGAKLSFIIVDKNGLTEIKGDKQSVGYKQSDITFEYINHTLDIGPNTVCYLYSDGIKDQCGGEKGFGFGKKRLERLLTENYQKPFSEQKKIIIQTVQDYQGNLSQRDDITIVGFSV